MKYLKRFESIIKPKEMKETILDIFRNLTDFYDYSVRVSDDESWGEDEYNYVIDIRRIKSGNSKYGDVKDSLTHLFGYLSEYNYHYNISLHIVRYEKDYRLTGNTEHPIDFLKDTDFITSPITIWLLDKSTQSPSIHRDGFDRIFKPKRPNELVNETYSTTDIVEILSDIYQDIVDDYLFVNTYVPNNKTICVEVSTLEDNGAFGPPSDTEEFKFGKIRKTVDRLIYFMNLNGYKEYSINKWDFGAHVTIKSRIPSGIDFDYIPGSIDFYDYLNNEYSDTADEESSSVFTIRFYK
jgi:hypothetical protein